jgi:hypothetical protein
MKLIGIWMTEISDKSLEKAEELLIVKNIICD